MASAPSLLADRRRRMLVLLVLAAIVFCALAGLALYREQVRTKPESRPETFFPNLAHNVREVTKIHIVSHANGAFDVVFKPAKGWVLPGRDDYPASFDEVRKAIVSMATLQTVEPKTARVDWLHYLDLDPPSTGGNGVLIVLSNENGKDLASLIIGKSEDIGDANGLSGYYVRKPDTMQSWLVKGALDVKSDPAAWMDKDIVNIDRARIREVIVMPQDSQTYTLSRSEPADPDFTVENLPEGRTLQSADAADGVASSIVGFSFDDVAPAKDFDFTRSSKLITKTFDGLVVSVSLIRKDKAYWAELSASTAPGHPQAQKAARQINNQALGWTYKLPGYKGAQFTTTLDSLLKPLAKKGKSKAP